MQEWLLFVFPETDRELQTVEVGVVGRPDGFKLGPVFFGGEQNLCPGFLAKVFQHGDVGGGVWVMIAENVVGLVGVWETPERCAKRLRLADAGEQEEGDRGEVGEFTGVAIVG